MKNSIFNIRLQRLKILGEIWATKKSTNKDPENLAVRIVNQYLATRKSLHEDHFEWSDEKTRAFREAEFLAAINWATLGPVIDLAQKGEEYLKNNELEEAANIFRELQNEKRMISKIKANIAQKIRLPHPITEIIVSILKNNPEISLPNLKKELKKLEGQGVIDEWDEEGNTIYFSNRNKKFIRSISITGLKDRLHEIRNLK